MNRTKKLLTVVFTLALGLGVWTVAISFSPTHSSFGTGDTLSASELNALLNDNYDAIADAFEQVDSEKVSAAGDDMSGSLRIETSSDSAALTLKNSGTGNILTAIGNEAYGSAIANDGDIILGPLSAENAATIRLDAETGTITNKAGSGLPLAFGSVSSDGTKRSGTSNWTVSTSGSGTTFYIDVEGISYHPDDFAVLVTPEGTSTMLAASTSWIGGGASAQLAVSLRNTSDERVANNFHFVIYQTGSL